MYVECFASRLEHSRVGASLSVNDVCRRTNLTSEQIKDFEAGICEPNLETLAIFANLYDVSIDWLLCCSVKNPKCSYK